MILSSIDGEQLHPSSRVTSIDACDMMVSYGSEGSDLCKDGSGCTVLIHCSMTCSH
jgi:hypothetical protein